MNWKLTSLMQIRHYIPNFVMYVRHLVPYFETNVVDYVLEQFVDWK